MAFTLNTTIGHSLAFFALNFASWLLRFDNDHPESPFLKFLGFVMVVLPCLALEIFMYYNSLGNEKQQQISTSLLIMGLNAGLFYQWYFLEPSGPPELLLRTAYAGYYGIVFAGISIMCGAGADEEAEKPGGNDGTDQKA